MNRTLIHGHCITKLNELPADSVHCMVTSPPYYRLRNYKTEPQIFGGYPECGHEWDEHVSAKTSGSKQGSTLEHVSEGTQNAQATRGNIVSWTCSLCGAYKGELGWEPTPDIYIRNLVSVFAACHRVLRPDGVLWVNIADSFAAGGHGHGGGSRSEAYGHSDLTGGYQGRKPPACWNLKKKDMMLIPHRMIIALQEFGWYVRMENIWNKPNPMRSSATDRTTLAHEYVFQLTKSEHYYFDAFAISTPVKTDTIARMFRGRNEHKNSGEVVPGQPAHSFLEARPNESHLAKLFTDENCARANRLSVWTIPASNFRDAHFATFPPELAKLCIMSSTSDVGCCAQCGAPYERMIERGEPDRSAQQACGGDADGLYFGEAEKDYSEGGAQDPSATKARILAGMVVKRTSGWKATCMCGTKAKKPCVVLDPFTGSGTVGEVCMDTKRDFIGIDLQADYTEMQKRRTAQPSLV